MRKDLLGGLVVLSLILLLLPCCVDDYELPKAISQSYQSEVVVEGRILSEGESVFYVTRTVPLISGTKEDIVTNAEVRIIGENVYVSELAENIEDTKYVINTGELPLNTNYAVEVRVGKEVYLSDFQPLLQIPEISELDWAEVPGKISVQPSTEGADESQKYFMCFFEKDWLFHAWIDMNDAKSRLPYFASLLSSDLVVGVNNPYYFMDMPTPVRFIYIQRKV